MRAYISEDAAWKEGYLPKSEFLAANLMPEATFQLLAHHDVGIVESVRVNGCLDAFWGWRSAVDEENYADDRATLDDCGRRFEEWRNKPFLDDMEAALREYDEIMDEVR